MYANEACTQRPEIGQSYSQLWVKVNRTIVQDAFHNWGDIDEPCTAASVSGPSEDPGLITCYVDFNSEDFDSEIAPGVYSVSSYDPITITAPLVVDFYG